MIPRSSAFQMVSVTNEQNSLLKTILVNYNLWEWLHRSVYFNKLMKCFSVGTLEWNCLGTCAPVPCCKKFTSNSKEWFDHISLTWVCASNFSRTRLKKNKMNNNNSSRNNKLYKELSLGKTLYFAVSKPSLFFLAHGTIMYLASGDELEFVWVTFDYPVSSFLAFLLSKG